MTKDTKSVNRRKILTGIVVFFLVVNTTQFWESKLGIFAFPAFLALVVIFLGFSVTLFVQVYHLIKEKAADRQRVYLLVVLTIVLALTVIRPFGLIDFDRFESPDIFIANREGGGNCTVTLKLKEDFTFKERAICFGVTETKGNFYLRNDTIYFDNVSLGRHEENYYQFAVLSYLEFKNGKKVAEIIRYKNLSDTIGHELWIEKNELYKLKEKKPNR